MFPDRAEPQCDSWTIATRPRRNPVYTPFLWHPLDIIQKWNGTRRSAAHRVVFGASALAGRWPRSSRFPAGPGGQIWGSLKAGLPDSSRPRFGALAPALIFRGAAGKGRSFPAKLRFQHTSSCVVFLWFLESVLLWTGFSGYRCPGNGPPRVIRQTSSFTF